MLSSWIDTSSCRIVVVTLQIDVQPILLSKSVDLVASVDVSFARKMQNIRDRSLCI